jgi:hypothetical protein
LKQAEHRTADEHDLVCREIGLEGHLVGIVSRLVCELESNALGVAI